MIYETRQIGRYYFILHDPKQPNAGKPITWNMTEAEVREFYRKKFGYSEQEIDQRFREAKERFVGKKLNI